MKTIFLLILLGMTAGCQTLSGVIDDPIVIKGSVRTTLYHTVRAANLNEEDIPKIIRSLDQTLQILTVALPPDFKKARVWVEEGSIGSVRIWSLNVIDMVERYTEPYLGKGSGKPDLEKVRAVIEAVIFGAREGFEGLI
jgi:hypothetical protein